MITALHLRADGTHELFEYDPADGLTVLQGRVGGWIEAAPVIYSEITMWCNEEGKILGLPHNETASAMLGPLSRDWIAGDVVLVGGADEDGNDTSLPEAWQEP